MGTLRLNDIDENDKWITIPMVYYQAHSPLRVPGSSDRVRVMPLRLVRNPLSSPVPLVDRPPGRCETSTAPPCRFMYPLHQLPAGACGGFCAGRLPVRYPKGERGREARAPVLRSGSVAALTTMPPRTPSTAAINPHVST